MACTFAGLSRDRIREKPGELRVEHVSGGITGLELDRGGRQQGKTVDDGVVMSFMSILTKTRETNRAMHWRS